jgi:LAO/AO transport system kinase
LDVSKLASGIRRGDRRALARGITLVENGGQGSHTLLRLAKPPMNAFILGVTGPPGAGKSTLVDRLVSLYRAKNLRVGIVAVDPTSPITGGALLGDRIRMSDLAGDEGVFIRSMASRGWYGGLSRAASQAIQLMDAAGYDVVFVETVGIGQSDIEVVRVSHAALVVLMPGLGDEVQVSKAGLMEVGDVYVVNKSDLEGADAMVVNLLGMVRGMRSRSPVVLKASARTGEGLDSLFSSVEALRSKFKERGDGLRLKSVTGMILETAKGDMLQRLGTSADSVASGLAREVLEGKTTIEGAAARLRTLLTARRVGRTSTRAGLHRSRQGG